MFIFYTPSSKNDKKNEENHDFVRFIGGSTMTTGDIQQGFETRFLNNNVMPLKCQ